MATYVSLLRWTDQGIRGIKDSPKRVDAAKRMFESAGGALRQFYVLMGEYDMLVISDAPDDEAAATIALATSSLGNVRTETFRAFTEGEFRKLVGSLP